MAFRLLPRWVGLPRLDVSLLIALFLDNEWTYDRHFPEADRIYRLHNNYRAQQYTCMKFANYYQTEPSQQRKLIDHLLQLVTNVQGS